MTEPGKDDVVTLNLPTENLILEGHPPHALLAAAIFRGIGGDLEADPRAHRQHRGRCSSSSSARRSRRSCRHVNGRATIEQICQVSYLSNLETCRLLWAFHGARGAAPRAAGRGGGARGGRPRERQQELDLEEHRREASTRCSDRIYSFLQGRIGDDVDAFMDEALARIAGQYEPLFDGVDLKQYGRADYDQMLANVADLPPEERRRPDAGRAQRAGRRRSSSACGSAYGTQEEAVVSGIIKEGVPQARASAKGGHGAARERRSAWRRTTTITRSSSPTSSSSSTSWPGPRG